MPFTFSFDKKTESEIAAGVAKLKESHSPAVTGRRGMMFSILHLQLRERPIPGFALAVGVLRKSTKLVGKEKVKRWLNRK